MVPVPESVNGVAFERVNVGLPDGIEIVAVALVAELSVTVPATLAAPPVNEKVPLFENVLAKYELAVSPPESVSVPIVEVSVVVTLAEGVTVVPTAIDVAVIMPPLVVFWSVADVAVEALAFTVIAPFTVNVFPLSTSTISPVPAAAKEILATVALPVSSSVTPVFI